MPTTFAENQNSKEDFIGQEDCLNSIVVKSKKLKMFLWAIHHATRITILQELRKKPMNVKDLSNLINELHSVTSFHLRHLRDQNLVKYEEDGKERIYSVTNILNVLSTPILQCDSILKE